MIYGSVCSGIESATVAWHSLGWEAAFYSEIEPAPCAVLHHYYPTVPNHGDMIRFKEWPDANLDVLVGGTPCQSFSVAGLRKGLDDPRGNLTLVYLAVADKYRPTWLVWENVPGVLSDGSGAFGAFLGGLGQLGYGFAYRVLDAQYFGVPQRRRRVFVVGHLGDWRCAAAVLFELASLRGDLAPRRESRQGVAPTIAARTRGGGGGLGTDFDCDGGLVGYSLDLANQGDGGNIGFRPDSESAICLDTNGNIGIAKPLPWPQEIADPISAAEGKTYTHEGTNFRLHNVVGHVLPFDTTQMTSAANRSNPKPGDPCHPLAEGAHPPAIAFAQNQIGEIRQGDVVNTLNTNSNASGRNTPMVAFADCFNGQITGEVAPTMGARGSSQNSSGPTLLQTMQVRRLTPRECERLQGFEDDYTLIPYKGRMMKDGPRYKMLGNSMAVPVMRWIGERIQMVEDLCAAQPLNAEEA